MPVCVCVGGRSREGMPGEEWCLRPEWGWKKKQVGDTGSHKPSSAVIRVHFHKFFMSSLSSCGSRGTVYSCSSGRPLRALKKTQWHLREFGESEGYKNGIESINIHLMSCMYNSYRDKKLWKIKWWFFPSLCSCHNSHQGPFESIWIINKNCCFYH